MSVKKELTPWIPWFFSKLKPDKDIALRKQYEVLATGRAGLAVAPPDVVYKPQYTDSQYMQLAAVLAATIGYGIHEYHVVEQCRRVYLISFAPLRHKDPLLPFVFRDYGRSYQRGYQGLINMLTSLSVCDWDYPLAKRYADQMVACVSKDGELTWHEVSYYEHWLYYTIAMPEKAI